MQSKVTSLKQYSLYKSADLSGEANGGYTRVSVPGSGRRKLVAASLLAVIIVIGVVVVSISEFNQSPNVTTINTYYNVGADNVVSGAVQQHPAGYVLQSSKKFGNRESTQLEDWAELGDSSGSLANLTVTVFRSTNASQTFYQDLVTSVRELPGYQDVSSSMASYQQYGGCYAYGEDVDSIAVINGICLKGNVILTVHLVSGVDFTTLESDATSLMGSLYNATR